MGKIVVFFLVICFLIGCKSTANRVDVSDKNVVTSPDNVKSKEAEKKEDDKVQKEDIKTTVQPQDLESIRQELTSHSDKLPKILAKIKDQQRKKDFEKIVADFDRDLKNSNDLNRLHEWKVVLAYLDSSYEQGKEEDADVQLVIKVFLASTEEFNFLPIVQDKIF